MKGHIHISNITAFFVFSILTCSCSINYASNQVAWENNSPEFTFNTAVLSRYEKNLITFSLQSDRIEQYSKTDMTWAKDATFQTWDENSEIDTEGSCGLLGITGNGEAVTFYSDIVLHNIKKDAVLKTDSLFWNTETSLAVSSVKDTTTLTSGEIEIEGYGFSANGDNNNYLYTSNVSGTIQTKD